MSAVARPLASLTGDSLRPGKGASKGVKEGDITSRIAAPVVMPVEPPPPVLAPAPAPAPAQRAPVDEPPPRAEEIVVYWERLRRGRPVPPIAELDRALVGNAWPGSLVVLFERDAAMPRISRLGTTDGAIEFTPMVTDWLLSRARQAAKRTARHEEVQTFPLEGTSARYRLFLLPLGMGTATTEGVLCHLCLA